MSRESLLSAMGMEEVQHPMYGGDKQPKRALGRGLSALIPQAGAPPAPSEGGLKGLARLPIESIVRDAAQPRKFFAEQALSELAESIRAQGVIQPILVRKEGAQYRLIAGERRWRAAQLVGLSEIPAIVKEASDAEAFQIALVENLQRADLNPLEEAEGYRRLIDEFQLTQEQVSERVGKDRSSVANSMRLLGLPEQVKALVADGSLGMGHARALLGLTEPEKILQLSARVVEGKLSVRDTERLVRDHKEGRARAPGQPAVKEPQSPQARRLVEELQRALGTKVRVVDRGGKGTLEIDFFSYADLDRVIGLIRK